MKKLIIAMLFMSSLAYGTDQYIVKLGTAYITTPELSATFRQVLTDNFKMAPFTDSGGGLYKVTLYSVAKSTIVPPTTPELTNLNTITNKLVSISSDTYVYGMASGMRYERAIDMGIITQFIMAYSQPMVSTKTVTETQCNLKVADGLFAAQQTIYQQNFSSGTILPPLVYPPNYFP